MPGWFSKIRAKTSSTPPPIEPPPRVISNGKAPIPLPMRLPLLAEQTAFVPPPHAKEHVEAWIETESKKQLKKILRARDKCEKELKKLRESEEYQQKENEDWMDDETVDFDTDSIRQPPEPWLSTEGCPHTSLINTRQSGASSRDTLFPSRQSSGTIFEGSSHLPTRGSSSGEWACSDSKRPPRFNDYRQERASRSLGRCIGNQADKSTKEPKRSNGKSSYQHQALRWSNHIRRSRCSENEGNLATGNEVSPRGTRLRKSFCFTAGNPQRHASGDPADNQANSRDACASQVDFDQDRIANSSVPGHELGTTSSDRGRLQRPVGPLTLDSYSAKLDPDLISPNASDHEAQDGKPICPRVATSHEGSTVHDCDLTAGGLQEGLRYTNHGNNRTLP